VSHGDTEVRDRRRTLRYRHLLVRQMVQMKNRISGLLMKTGVSHNKQRFHKVKYFRELLSGSGEITESIRPLLELSRDTIVRLQKTEYALVRSLERDPVLAERVKRLRTAPGVGPIAALSWALEIGDVTRFRSVKQAISYCGLCGDEKSSADKTMRTPLSKQRNKHIQRALVEAAKLAPRHSHELAIVREKELQKGNANRATLAVAPKMVAYLLAWIASSATSSLQKSAGSRRHNRRLRQRKRTKRRAGCQVPPLPTERRSSTPEAPTEPGMSRQ
jgi:transposase